MKSKKTGARIAIGIAIGAAIGAATDNMAGWIGIGAALGLALNMLIPDQNHGAEE